MHTPSFGTRGSQVQILPLRPATTLEAPQTPNYLHLLPTSSEQRRARGLFTSGLQFGLISAPTIPHRVHTIRARSERTGSSSGQ
jgi:hypothetical protein